MIWGYPISGNPISMNFWCFVDRRMAAPRGYGGFGDLHSFLPLLFLHSSPGNGASWHTGGVWFPQNGDGFNRERRINQWKLQLIFRETQAFWIWSGKELAILGASCFFFWGLSCAKKSNHRSEPSSNRALRCCYMLLPLLISLNPIRMAWVFGSVLGLWNQGVFPWRGTSLDWANASEGDPIRQDSSWFRSHNLSTTKLFYGCLQASLC